MMQSIWKEADMTSWTSSWEEGFWGSYVGPVLVSLPSIIYSIGVFFANLYYRQLINRLTEWGISLPPPSFRLVTFHVPPAPGSIPQSFIRQSDATVSTDDGSGDVDWRRSAIDSHLIHIWVGKTNSNFFFSFLFFSVRKPPHRVAVRAQSRHQADSLRVRQQLHVAVLHRLLPARHRHAPMGNAHLRRSNWHIFR